MKLAALCLIIMSALSLFLVPSEAKPAKIPINAIKKGAKIVSNGLNAINIASSAHDTWDALHKKKH